MAISNDLLDELLNGVENANDLLGEQGLMKELKVRLWVQSIEPRFMRLTALFNEQNNGFHPCALEHLTWAI